MSITVADENQIKDTLSLAIENEIILSRIADLETITDGWLDGRGKAVNKELIVFLYSEIIPILAYMKEAPYITPTEEGGVSIEYDFNGQKAILIEISPDLSIYYHYMDLSDDSAKKDKVLLFSGDDSIKSFNLNVEWDYSHSIIDDETISS